jgi:hypothetical protein
VISHACPALRSADGAPNACGGRSPMAQIVDQLSVVHTDGLCCIIPAAGVVNPDEPVLQIADASSVKAAAIRRPRGRSTPSS